MRRVPVTRTGAELEPDPCRVVARPHLPGEDPSATGHPRLERLVHQVLALSQEDVVRLLADVEDRFLGRHRDMDAVLERHAAVADRLLGEAPRDRRRLVGAYLTKEYAFEGAALTNPSMVPAPDQSGLRADQLRFVLSLRAVGEGHISSIEFRTGVLDGSGSVRIDPPAPWVTTGDRRRPLYERELFTRKLAELRADVRLATAVLDQLEEYFTFDELKAAEAALDDLPPAVSHETRKMIDWLATSNYVATFPPETELSERLLFPELPVESRGMEDARFVRFAEDDGSTTYYATYTAYDGFEILPQLIETVDFTTFEIATLNGSSAQNKGMALFPRRIGGRYVTLTRPDRENIHITSSDNLRFWGAPSVVLRRPEHPWELIQMGNCGSPIETEAGWLVLTHGVGPVRTYRIGAMLLDRDDPERVTGNLPEPLLEAQGHERDGYVPNVVYSCGGLLHGGTLVLPYGISDMGSRVALVPLDDLVERMLDAGP